MKPLASRLSVLTGEGALTVYLRAKELERAGRSIIHLELGEPDFHPAEPVVAALEKAVRDGKDRYCPMAGVPALKEEIAAYLHRTRSINVSPENVVVAPGCKLSLFFALMTILEAGDEVLWPDPGFPGYASITRGFDGTPVPFGLDEKNKLQPDPDEIAAKITPRTKAIVLNSPCNPTGTVYTDAVQRRIAELAVQHDLYVLSDEIYARIIYGQKYNSMLSYPGMAERTLIIDGFSKSFAMTGWRLGYTIAPPELVPHLVMLAINSYTCTAEFTQYAAIEALRDSTGATPRMVAEFLKRREQFIADLNRVPGFRCIPPEGAFYAWVNIEDTGLPAEEVQKLLLEQAGVAAIAGAAFGAQGKNYIRFSLVSARHLLEDALDRIHRVSVKWRGVTA